MNSLNFSNSVLSFMKMLRAFKHENNGMRQLTNFYIYPSLLIDPGIEIKFNTSKVLHLFYSILSKIYLGDFRDRT